MSLVVVDFTSDQYPIFQDTQTGARYIYYTDTDEWVQIRAGNITPQLPSVTTSGGSSGGVLITSGHSWYEDLLNAFLGLSAIGANAPYIPSTNQGAYYQQRSSQASAEQLAAQRAAAARSQNLGGTFGSSFQNFIQQNTGLLLVGGIGLVLWKSGRK